MADIKKPTKAESDTSSKPRPPSKFQQSNKIYGLPAPVRTFPLPTFVPHNPISLFQILCTWLSQAVFPPSSHPETLYKAWFSPETLSVHVTDPETIKALFQQGFYGKGIFSRSEPSWLEREKKRRGVTGNETSEEYTRKRRAERQQVKWERARKEREAIEQQIQVEKKSASIDPSSAVTDESIEMEVQAFAAPVGPLELLALPNSDPNLASNPNGALLLGVNGFKLTNGFHKVEEVNHKLMNGNVQETVSDSDIQENGFEKSAHSKDVVEEFAMINGDGHVTEEMVNGNSESPQPLKRRKSVRFSPTIEQATYILSDPPSPELAATRAKGDEPPLVLEDLEHLQLTREETLFLTYGLGVLNVYNPSTRQMYSNKELFALFRSVSPFSSSSSPLPSPDDSFLVSYVVYHHFRSLGWVIRGGIKFSCDYLLYNRGPVFNHAEFGILIIPSYSDSYWSADAATRAYVEKKERRKWSWVHCMNRVSAQVKKTLVLVYVDIPPPLEAHVEEELGITGVLKRYKVREFVIKRWTANRDRD